MQYWIPRPIETIFSIIVGELVVKNRFRTLRVWPMNGLHSERIDDGKLARSFSYVLAYGLVAK